MKYYIHDQGKDIGPLLMPQIASMWREGAISETALYASEGSATWMPLIRSEEMAAYHPTPAAEMSPGLAAIFKGVAVLAVLIPLFLLFRCQSDRSDGDAIRYTPVETTSGSSGVAVDAWDGTAVSVKRWLKANTNDPGSLKIVEVSKVIPQGDGYMQRVKFRAKNGLGALVLSERIFIMNSKGDFVSSVPKP